jgi:hypothetical protein
LFAALVEGEQVSFKELWRDFASVVGALRPVILVKPEQVSRVAPAARVADLAVVIAGESLSLAELIPTLARAKQVIVIGDAHAATRSAVAAFATLLPQLRVHALPVPRDPRVTAVLGDAAYGRELTALPAADGGGGLDVLDIEAQGEAGLPAGEVWTTRAEVAAVLERVAQVEETLPRRSIAVVAGNDAHANAIIRALHTRAARWGATVPVVTLGNAAGMSVDEIVVSMGCARDADGVIPARAGVLSESWGVQALTQALVASRAHVTLVSALSASAWEAMVASADEGHGIEELRDLMVAADHPPVSPERLEPAPSDWLLADVARRLRQEGYAVRLRYGSGFDTIPMVVGGRHDRDYHVAVVTDEAVVMGQVSIRDRLRWQYARLEALGWTVVPLWTVDVFMDPHQAMARVRAVLDGEDVPMLETRPEPEPEPEQEPEPEPKSEPEPEPGPEPGPDP